MTISIRGRMPRKIGLALTVGALVSSAAWAIDEVRYFESNSLAGFRVSGNSPTVQSNIKRGGKYGMKSYLSASAKNNYRTEVKLKAADPKVGKEYWYGFSIFLPSDFKPDRVWEMVAQWHGWPDSGDNHPGPPLKLQTTNGVWKLLNKSNPNRKTVKDGTSSRSFKLGPYSTGRWTDWVFRIKWSYKSDGLLQVWKNGKKVVSRQGANTYNDERMPYFKMGIYKGWKKRSPDKVKTRTLYHDQLRFYGPGGSYSKVAPTSSSTIKSAYDVSVY